MVEYTSHWLLIDEYKNKAIKMSDSDSDWQDESLMLVEMNGIIDRDWMKTVGNKCKIIGVETDHPLLQLDRYTFTGEYTETLGTDILFEIKERSESELAAAAAQRAATDSGLGDSDTMKSTLTSAPPCKYDLKQKYSSAKRLTMTRAFLTPRDQLHPDTVIDQPQPGPIVQPVQPVRDQSESKTASLESKSEALAMETSSSEPQPGTSKDL